MKKLVAAMFAAVLTVCFAATAAGCGNGITIPSADTEGGYTIKIGYTEYAPMNYHDDGGAFVGYDTEFAIELCEDLGYKYEFVLLNNWETKVVDLNAGTIDLIWNGMTITEDLKKSILVSDPYLNNMQVVVAKTENIDQYTDIESLKNASKIAFETGSAAQALVEGIDGIQSSQTVLSVSQARALMEVAAGTADVAVIDYTMAMSMTGEGTSYAGISYKDVGFEAEEYGIGARKADSEFMEKLNAKIAEYKENGFLDGLYEKYFAAKASEE